MREKQLRLIVTFYTTADAMAMEKHCKDQAVPGRLIPVPRAVTSDCGIAWCCDVAQRAQIEALAESVRIEAAGYYEMMV